MVLMRGIVIGVKGDRVLPSAPIKTCNKNRLKSK
jgi:hypothetical protein